MLDTLDGRYSQQIVAQFHHYSLTVHRRLLSIESERDLRTPLLLSPLHLSLLLLILLI